jgi:hypothetical protein
MIQDKSFFLDTLYTFSCNVHDVDGTYLSHKFKKLIWSEII